MLRAPPIAQVKATTPQAAFAWDREIRIDERDRVAVAPGRDVTRSAITIITGVLSLALALFLGWVGGFNLDSFSTKPVRFPSKEPTLQQIHPMLPNRSDWQCKAHRRTLLPQQPVARMRPQNAAPKPRAHCYRNRLQGHRNRLRSRARRVPPNPQQCQRRDRQPSRGGQSVRLMAVRWS